MGAGKTTIGRVVAASLNLEFFDADQELERHTGADVTLIFDIEGESGFRRREQQMIKELSERSGVLLATGGGAVLNPENCKILRSRGFVVYLNASVDLQLARLRRDKKRPLLQAPDRRQRLETMRSERGPLYQAIADLTVLSDRCGVPAMARRVVSQLRQQPELAALFGVGCGAPRASI